MTTKDFFSYLHPYRTTLALASLLMIGESLATLATPWFAGVFAQLLLSEQALQVAGAELSLVALLPLWLLVFFVQALLKFFSTYLATSSGAKVLASLSNRLYEHLQALPLEFYRQQKRGDLLSLISNDIAIVSHFISGVLVALIPTLVTLAGALVLMAMIDPTVALAIFVLVPAFFIILKFLGKKIRPVSEALVQRQADSLAMVDENLGLIPLIKTYNREHAESQRYRQHIQNVLSLRKEQLRLQALLSPAAQLLVSGGFLIVLWISGQHLMDAKITAPEMVSLLLYGLLFARPVSNLANLYGQAQQALGASQRLRRIFSIQPEPHHEHFAELPSIKGNIEFCGLRFNYPGREPLWEGLNLRISAGETVAIVGPNGMGKTTLLHLLMRFDDPQHGKILIDGHDIRQVSLSSLRQQLGFVSQHTLLSDGTIADNIRYGHPEASQEAVEKVAKQACVHDFVSDLPEGYQTSIGELGAKLSGGQRQRIALARVLLGHPQVLLLDEATSMFDPHGELQFIAQSRELLERLTVIFIAHSEASLALADRVLRLENGKLVDVSDEQKSREVI